MILKPVLGVVALAAGLISQTSCIVGVGDWERLSKDLHSRFPLTAGGVVGLEACHGPGGSSGWDEGTGGSRGG